MVFLILPLPGFGHALGTLLTSRYLRLFFLPGIHQPQTDFRRHSPSPASGLHSDATYSVNPSPPSLLKFILPGISSPLPDFYSPLNSLTNKRLYCMLTFFLIFPIVEYKLHEGRDHTYVYSPVYPQHLMEPGPRQALNKDQPVEGWEWRERLRKDF